MKQNASANIPRALAKASPAARGKWERAIDLENLAANRIVESQIKRAMKDLQPKLSRTWTRYTDEWCGLNDKLKFVQAEIRAIRTKLYGKWLAIAGFTAALSLAFVAGVLVGRFAL